jgi:thiamine transport system ATP-binding protein
VTVARLATSDLAIGYPDRLVASSVNLQVAPGEIVAITGPSGSGKSTLLATIAGVLPAVSGRILVNDVDITEAPIHRRGVGLIFQEPLLFPHLDVRGNVAYGFRRHGATRAGAARCADELLEWVDLAGYGERSVEELSGGQAQRVALARALAPGPAVLLLDEPFSALDVDLRQRLAAEVAAMLRRQGVAAVHVTHDPQEAAAMADRVLSVAEIDRPSRPDLR